MSNEAPAMQNRSIDQYQRVLRDRQALERILFRGEHIAAGLHFELVVGKASEESEPLVFDVSWFTKEILQTMVDSLKQSEKFWLNQIRREHEALSTFIASVQPAKETP